MRDQKPKDWTDKELKRLVQLANEGTSSVAIAKELGRYVASIKRKARSLGLLLRK
jgi:hypothetical protein